MQLLLDMSFTAVWRSLASLQMVIFCRTGADIAKFGVGGDEAAMMSLVRAAAAEAAAAAGAEAGASAVPSRAAACVLQLRGMGSSHEVGERINAFLSTPLPDAGALLHQRVLLLLGDMSVVSAPQLNYARQLVDAALELIPPAHRPLVLALVHCPPEQLQLGFPYHAVPASDWGFTFCDALGLSDAIPDVAAATAVATAAGGVSSAASAPAPASTRLATDPRRWVAVGYGLLDRPTPDEARVEFEAEFVKALRQAISGVSSIQNAMDKKLLIKRDVVAADTIYIGRTPGITPQKRVEAAMAIFQTRPYLRDILLDCFVHTWGDTLQVCVCYSLSLFDAA